jgi:hypothetical protein
MRVELLQPDAPFETPLYGTPEDDGVGTFESAVDAVGKALTDATLAEDAYAHGRGSLQDAQYRRAQADIALAVASAAVQRSAQAVQTLLNVQI